jgi:hypothetical protein
MQFEVSHGETVVGTFEKPVDALEKTLVRSSTELLERLPIKFNSMTEPVGCDGDAILNT